MTPRGVPTHPKTNHSNTNHFNCDSSHSPTLAAWNNMPFTIHPEEWIILAVIIVYLTNNLVLIVNISRKSAICAISKRT